jgi:hypothetical protein
MNNTHHFPQKTFDHDYASIIELYVEKKWSVPNLNMEEIIKDAVAMKNERIELDKLERSYVQFKENFYAKQDARSKTYSELLAIARAMSKKEPELKVALDRYKADRTKKKKDSTDSTNVV